MQDKDFDQLFRDKFEEAEVQPSAHLWNNIEAEINKPKRKFPVYWMAAALAVAALGIGLLVNQPALEKEKSLVTIGATKAASQAVHQDTISSDSRTAPGLADIKNALAAESASRPVAGAVHQEVFAVAAQQNLSPEKSDIQAAHADQEENRRAAAMTEKKDLLAMQPSGSIVHHDNNELVVTQHKSGLPESTRKPEALMLASADEKTASNEVINENDTNAENKGIRNVGDLINFVVDKVDKREDKLIQFKTEDDNSSLVALNIGMFKFNQRRQK